MARFLAIDPEIKDKDGKAMVLPFNLKRFIGVMESDDMTKMPPVYCGVCSICFKPTYFAARNRGKSMDVIPA